MYRIGEFSSMTELSKETLRYYADIRLLVPVYIDPTNNYKYYDNNSFLTARLLFYLHKFDFTIQEMLQVVHEQSLDDLEEILLGKKRKLQQKVVRISMLIDDIDSFINEGKGEDFDT